MRSRLRFYHYIVLGNLFLVIVPMLIIGLWNLYVYSDSTRISIVKSREIIAVAVGGRMEEFFARSVDALDAICDILEHEELYRPDEIPAILDRQIALHAFFSRIQVIGSEDVVLFASPGDSEYRGLSHRGEEAYEAVKASWGVHWTPTYVSIKNNEPGLSFGRKVRGFVVMCDLNLSEIGRSVSAAYAHFRPEVEVRVTDGRGVFVYHPDAEKVRQRQLQESFGSIKAGGKSLFSLRYSSGGEEYLASVHRIHYPDWYVIVATPFKEAFAPLLIFYRGFFLIVLVSVGVDLLLSILFRKRLFTSLRLISEKADKVARGEFEALVDFGGEFEEFRLVSRSFNEMVAGLKARETSLLAKERGFRESLENILLLAVMVDRSGRILFANKCFMNLCGITEESGRRSVFEFLGLEGDGGKNGFASFRDGDLIPQSFECLFGPPGRAERLVTWTMTKNPHEEGREESVTGIGMDITEQRRQSEAIESALLEKEVLLKEVHHRVKNNLQIIRSLLSLQRNEIEDPRAALPLAEAGARINSIALIHERLYGSNNFGNIAFAEYTKDLAREVLKGTAEPVDLSFDLDDIRLELGRAIPCGLILNEIFMNIQKYAFPDGFSGERIVRIGLKRNSGGLVELSVRDSGVGLPSGYDASLSKSLGHTLLHLLAKQIGGKVEIFSDGGTVVRLTY